MMNVSKRGGSSFWKYKSAFLITTTIIIFTFLSLSPIALINVCEARREHSTFNTNDFFIFVAKFGFQKTITFNQNITQGYIFGNITTDFPGYDNGLSIPNISYKNKVFKRASSVPTPNNSIINNKMNGSNSNDVDDDSVKTFNNVWSNVNNNYGQSQSKIENNSNGNFSSPSPASPSTSLGPNIKKFPSSTTVSPIISKPTSSSTSLVSTQINKSRTKSPLMPNASSSSSQSRLKYFPATLVVTDRSYFVDFYRSRLIEDKDEACAQMFRSISETLYDAKCFPYQKETFLRRIPCNKNGYCIDEGNISTIVHNHQFTYAIGVKNQPRFWYVSIVACYLDQTTCQWKHSANANISIDYDIWLVNGNPYQNKQNPLEYQFSFDKKDTAEIYLVFFICYLILVPLQIHAVLRQRHIVPRLFTASVALEFTAVLANVIHILTFSSDGEGYPKLAVFGDILDILARAIFMLILLVLAKGWAVTRVELRSKPLIFSIWVMYSVIHILLYVWNQTEVDVIEDIEEYQTWPGWLILILRTLIMVWFVYELKDTMDHEHQPHKLNFFLHFGAAALVWFIYLPIVALIALQLSPLWRSKLLLGITYSADCLAFATMTHLLWPTRSQQYFLLASNIDTSMNDELEEFNEAPHVVDRNHPRHNNRIQYSVHNVTYPESVSLSHTKKSSNNHSHQNIHNNRTNSTIHSQSNGNGTNHNNSFSGGTYVDDKDNVMLIQT